MMTRAWNCWYHCMGNTYGTWLRGDPRGWRARHHREHVEGDYRKPPPKGTYDALRERSKELMKRKPVRLEDEDIRKVVLNAVLAKLIEKGIKIAAACMDDHHLHLLARFPDHRPRHWIGMAKKNAAHVVRRGNGTGTGGIWAKRSKAQPIKDQAHHIKARDYILDHAKRGAVTWVHPELLEKMKKAHG